MTSTTFALLSAAGLAAGAMADIPSFHRPWIPDLDQLRATGFGQPGLPADGQFHSGPTAAANIMVYLDRHGYTNMLPSLSAADSLFSPQAYGLLTQRIGALGNRMNTLTNSNGTWAFEAARGLREVIFAQYSPGEFIVVHKDSTNADPVGPDDFVQAHDAGAVCFQYIRSHQLHVSGTWVMSGAGFRTITSVVGGPLADVRVRWRSGSNTPPGDNLYSQGSFRYHESHAALGVFNLAAPGQPSGDRLRWRYTNFDGPDTLVTCEGLIAVVPIFGITLSADDTQIIYEYPVGVLGSLLPNRKSISIPPGFHATKMAMNAMGPGATLLTPAVGASSLYIMDRQTGAFTFVEGIIGPGPMAFCRHNCLWYVEQSTLKKATLHDDGTVIVGPTLNLGGVPNALATMDELDQTAVLVAGQIRLFNGELALQDSDPLPDAAVIAGVPCFAPDPANPMDLLIGSSGITTIHRIRRTASGWGYIEGIQLPAGTQITSLQVGGGGDIYYVNAGRIRQLERNLMGDWVPAAAPTFDPNAPVGPLFVLPYSRSNRIADPASENLPEQNIDPPGDGIVGCDPDLTTSSDPSEPTYGIPDGVLDASDFFFFLDRFVAGDRIVCDLTTTSDPNSDDYGAADGVLDASDFFFYLDLFASGCP